MRYILDEEIIEKNGLDMLDVLLTLVTRISQQVVNMCEVRHRKGKFYRYDRLVTEYAATEKMQDLVDKCLLEAENSLPTEEHCVELARAMRELFPQGMKVKNVAWRNNPRDVSRKLMKFFKVYGIYSDEEILNATKRYIESFHGDYQYMRVLKYFIMKSEIKINEDGERYVEEVSELANFLENDSTEEYNDDPTMEIR